MENARIPFHAGARDVPSGSRGCAERFKPVLFGDDGTARLRAYEKRVYYVMRYYWDMVDKFYTQPFMELFLEPRPKFNIPDAIVAILAGEVDGGWKLELRRKIFFLLIWAQRHWQVVPKISFEDFSQQDVDSHRKFHKHFSQIPE